MASWEMRFCIEKLTLLHDEESGNRNINYCTSLVAEQLLQSTGFYLVIVLHLLLHDGKDTGLHSGLRQLTEDILNLLHD